MTFQYNTGGWRPEDVSAVKDIWSEVQSELWYTQTAPCDPPPNCQCILCVDCHCFRNGCDRCSCHNHPDALTYLGYCLSHEKVADNKFYTKPLDLFWPVHITLHLEKLERKWKSQLQALLLWQMGVRHGRFADGGKLLRLPLHIRRQVYTDNFTKQFILSNFYSRKYCIPW